MKSLYHMTSNSKILTWVVCLSFLASCTGEHQEHQETARKQFELHEVLRLGDEAQGDTVLFGSVTRLAVNQMGNIFVAEQRPWILHAFGADGAYLTAIGGTGQGPGEYQYGFGGPVIGPADSVYLWCFWPHTRIQIYDPEEYHYVRSVDVTIEEEDQRNFSPFIGAVDDGWIMGIGLHPIMTDDNDFTVLNEDTDRELIQIHQDGSFGPQQYGTIMNDEDIYHIYEDTGGFTWGDVPFGRSTLWTYGPDGMLYYGWNDTIEINAVDVDHASRHVINYDVESVPITDAEMAVATETDQPIWEELYAAHSYHETKPAFQALAADESSRVWIKLSSHEGAIEAEWIILDKDSQLVGQFELPQTVHLEVIQGGYAYGIEHEEGSAPMVVVYEIQESEARPQES